MTVIWITNLMNYEISEQVVHFNTAQTGADTGFKWGGGQDFLGTKKS